MNLKKMKEKAKELARKGKEAPVKLLKRIAARGAERSAEDLPKKKRTQVGETEIRERVRKPLRRRLAPWSKNYEEVSRKVPKFQDVEEEMAPGYTEKGMKQRSAKHLRAAADAPSFRGMAKGLAKAHAPRAGLAAGGAALGAMGGRAAAHGVEKLLGGKRRKWLRRGLTAGGAVAGGILGHQKGRKAIEYGAKAGKYLAGKGKHVASKIHSISKRVASRLRRKKTE